jgi:hypothetical protein
LKKSFDTFYSGAWVGYGRVTQAAWNFQAFVCTARELCVQDTQIISECGFISSALVGSPTRDANFPGSLALNEAVLAAAAIFSTTPFCYQSVSW